MAFGWYNLDNNVHMTPRRRHMPTGGRTHMSNYNSCSQIANWKGCSSDVANISFVMMAAASHPIWPRDLSLISSLTNPMPGCPRQSQCSLTVNCLMGTLTHLSAFHQPHGLVPSWVICSDTCLMIVFLQPGVSRHLFLSASGIPSMRVSKHLLM